MKAGYIIGGLAALGITILLVTKIRAAPAYKLVHTCIEDETGFPITIDPSTDPGSDKIKAGEPVTLWQYWQNTTGEPMPSWSIAMSVTYPDGTVTDLSETRGEISASEEWGYAVFTPFTPTSENIYGDVSLRTYIVSAELLVEGKVTDKISVKLIAQV